MSKLYCLLALLLLQACSVHNHVANRDWHVVATENFIIYTDSNVELVAELAKDLERFRITVPNLTTASLMEDKKLIIYAAGSQTTYRALVGDELANKTAGSFQPNMYGDIAFVNMSAYANTRKHKSYWVRRFLFHEYTHFLAHTNTPVNYPYWYIEGYAELLSTMEFDGNKINLGGIPAEREYDLVVNGLMDVQALLTAQRGSLNKHDNAGLYASAWLFVHMLSMKPQYQEKIPDYLLLQAKSEKQQSYCRL
ncbi:hypothetical protein NO559_11720 [Dasania sp. GY-MA-18]|uniref:Uncharacterized protein n=1 Tax=Dasania phycosphaerae TaxID=2950436 RepID=A0A9J6RP22_9GAMM|nr:MULTISPECIES: hypothetical protein [Dasania]MCR8923446.1 hypothetical protein [Dasania sp. GY-MA-18]MCZ0865879.1 hypothetical protein [Dasania phycosphaerae]MCZ0869603.1 hypothetical protein [Dasania phycosphaerae]